LYLADLDKNGTVDPLLTYSIDQREYTFLGKGDIEKEVPVIKKKFLYYHDFAGKTVSELFGDSLKYSESLTANSFTSGVFYNKGNGNFEFRAFPSGAQTAPLFGFAALAGTGKAILAGGNFSGVLPYEGRYDADYGDVIFTDKNRGLRCISPVSSGFLLRGEVRDIKAIKTANGLIYAVAFNNSAMKFFKLAK
jgi:enediyne biosynthesis protein E4